MSSITPHKAWQAVLNRDHRYDERFVYAVLSTKIYCRPSCPARRPSHHQVAFFPSAQKAETAGFRACLRCRPQLRHDSRTDRIIHEVRRYLDERAEEPITLRQLTQRFGLSSFHLQRTFTRTIGVSPKTYQNALRMERFTASLKGGQTVTDAVYEAGFGSNSRLYERASTALGMTPGAYRAGGAGVTLRYATVSTPIGRLLIASTRRGLAAVRLGDRVRTLVAGLRRDYPNATLLRDHQGLRRPMRLIVKCLESSPAPTDLQLDVKGTPFQRTVWLALQQIPRGSTRTYRTIARSIGQPQAVRAVARACADNPIALAIPCHRVVREDGTLAGYRWGLKRKQRLLALERKP